MRIQIAKSEIANAVYRLTANAERERGDNQLVATPDNESLVYAFIDDAAMMVAHAVEFYGTAYVDGDFVAAELDVPCNWGGNEAVLKDTMRVICENYAVARWFELNGTADRFNAAVETAVLRVKRLLEQRKKPL